MTLLRVDASIQGPRSASSELADLVLAEWSAARPDGPSSRRHLGADPLPADAWAAAVGAALTPRRAAHRRPARGARAGRGAGRRAARRPTPPCSPCRCTTSASPSTSRPGSTWLIAGGAARRALLDGKPVVLLTTRGGAYGPGTPREGWDHNTAYLRRILADVWGADLTVVEREFTLVGVNPALDEFTEEAELKQRKSPAEEAAGRRRTRRSRGDRP